MYVHLLFCKSVCLSACLPAWVVKPLFIIYSQASQQFVHLNKLKIVI
jgi:hypothetical protein